jgi:hypothetical protein
VSRRDTDPTLRETLEAIARHRADAETEPELEAGFVSRNESERSTMIIDGRVVTPIPGV